MKTTNGIPRKGIPCNETRHTVKACKDRITFRFVTDDANTPSECTVRLGDIDPRTGEQITDMTFMTEYYKLVDHEIYVYWKDRRATLTPAEEKQREERWNHFLDDYESRFGYRPSEADLRWLTDEFMSRRYNASIEWYRDQEGNPECDRISRLGIPSEDPFGTDEPENISRLHELTESLNGLQADIYEWLLVKYAGGQVKLSLKSIADKWDICLSQAYKEKDKLVQMIRKIFEN